MKIKVLPTLVLHGFPRWLSGKESARQCRSHKSNSLVLKIPLEEKMATLSSILAWKIPWTEESSRLQSKGLHRARHNWVIEHKCREKKQKKLAPIWLRRNFSSQAPFYSLFNSFNKPLGITYSIPGTGSMLGIQGQMRYIPSLEKFIIKQVSK